MTDEEFIKRNNLRRIDIESCENCEVLWRSDTCAVCDREGGPLWDLHDREEQNHVCDKFKRR